MKKGDFVFVYGTLRKGERAHEIMTKMLEGAVTFVAEDIINGRLYHIGAYPGIKTEPCSYDKRGPKVYGEVYLIRGPSVTPILDGYEGYIEDFPEKGLYNRIQTETRKGREVWVYTYNPPVRDEQFIETGDWKNPRLPSQHNQLQVRKAV